MKKNFVIMFLILTIALLLTLSCGAAETGNDQVIVIGQNGIYDLNGALNALGQNAGNAVIYLSSSLNQNAQIELPSLSGLKSVTLASYTGSPVTLSLGGSVICANGVPFTVDQGVTVTNGYIVGGKCVAQPGSSSVGESLLIINGDADLVIGGGLAMGAGTTSNVGNVNIIVNGSANNIHGGGYAYDGGVAGVSGMVNEIITRTGVVNNALYSGGYASGAGSNAPVGTAYVIALGSVGTLEQAAGLAENGGSAPVGTANTTEIELKNPQAAIPTIVPTAQPVYIPAQPVVAPVPTSTVMYVGPNQQAQNFTDAVNLLPQSNAGNVEFRIMGNFKQETDVVIPGNRGILSVTVTGNNNTRMTVSWPEDVGFFANGIPLTIESSVTFKDGVVYGGANVVSGQQSTLQTSYLDIAGTVNKVVAGSKAKGSAAFASVYNTTLIFRGKATGWLYGGGAALYGGHSSVEGTATMNVMQGASVELSIAGGGYAFGAGSESVVNESNMNVGGSIIYAAFLGGYADQSSSASTLGLAYLNLEATGVVGQSVWYGGRAFYNSNVYVDTAAAQISGRVGATVHREGRGSDGGTVSIRDIR